MNNQMKIENEHMTVEFDAYDKRDVIITDKASGEICRVSIMNKYLSLKSSKEKYKVYLEWGGIQ